MLPNPSEARGWRGPAQAGLTAGPTRDIAIGSEGTPQRSLEGGMGVSHQSQLLHGSGKAWHGIRPEPIQPNPEALQYGASIDTFLHSDSRVAAVLAEHVEAGLLVLRIDDPVLANA